MFERNLPIITFFASGRSNGERPGPQNSYNFDFYPAILLLGKMVKQDEEMPDAEQPPLEQQLADMVQNLNPEAKQVTC